MMPKNAKVGDFILDIGEHFKGEIGIIIRIDDKSFEVDWKYNLVSLSKDPTIHKRELIHYRFSRIERFKILTKDEAMVELL